MILFINGDSHAAGAEAVVPYGWACDDSKYWTLGERPHPLNEAASFGNQLAQKLGWTAMNYAQSGGSNPRIIRTTQHWIEQNSDKLSNVFMLIQWSTWERQEWLHQNIWYQVNASGVDTVPNELKTRYQQFVASIDWVECTRQAHNDVWQFHQYLKQLNIPHLMFNGNSHFAMPYRNKQDLTVPVISKQEQQDWNCCYIEPYNPEMTYNNILKTQGFQYVYPDSYHFGQAAHCFWADFLLQYMQSNNLIVSDEISTD